MTTTELDALLVRLSRKYADEEIAEVEAACDECKGAVYTFESMVEMMRDVYIMGFSSGAQAIYTELVRRNN